MPEPVNYFKATDPSGDCIQYSQGDIVVRNGKSYVAKIAPVLCLPPENKDSGWELVSTTVTYYNSSTAPIGINPGDEWFNPDTGKLYKYIVDADSKQWVQIY
jgi:hypothetical protein